MVKLSSDSKLKIIENHAFSKSSIRSFKFPLYITKICDESFFDCKNFCQVEILKKSELHTIGKNAFANTSIESFSFQVNLTKIEDGAFSTPSIRKIDIPYNSKLQTIEAYAFNGCHFKSLFLPPVLVNFYLINLPFDLQIIEIAENSKL